MGLPLRMERFLWMGKTKSMNENYFAFVCFAKVTRE
jgi:hypothetical protein